MAIKVSCTCGKKISAKDEFAGRRVKCPACKKPLQIPEANVEEESYEDEWDLDDYGEDEADAQPVRTRRTNKSTKSISRKSGRKSKPNLLLGLSAGGGILLVVVLVWMFWPSDPDGDVANSSAVAAIEDLGGEITFDETVPGKPAIGVTLVLSKPVTDASLEHLKELTSLRRLSFRGPFVTDTELVHLKGMKNLQTLRLYDTKVTDAGLVHLKNMKKLQNLELRGNLMTDSSLAHLKEMTSLKSLVLPFKTTNAGLGHLKGLTNLQNLELIATRVTDAGLLHLKGMKNLQTLDFNSTGVTDAGLEYLKRLTNLQSLNLTRTKITDAGLEHLKGLTSLESLDLTHTKVTSAGVKHLQATLPKCKILGGNFKLNLN